MAVKGALEAIYAWPKGWEKDPYGKYPKYQSDCRDGRFALKAGGTVDESLNAAETADVFIAILTKIASLNLPDKNIARLRIDEITELRCKGIRNGSAKKLRLDIEQEVRFLAGLRLMGSWRDYKGGEDILFGRESPDCLLKVEREEHHKTGELKAIEFRSGKLITHLLGQKKRWVGHYARALLLLDPYHEAYLKKLGTYWCITGVIAGKMGNWPHASPRTIFKFCGISPDERNPRRTVMDFIEAHKRLKELRILEEVMGLFEPPKQRNYLDRWLDTPVRVKLSPAIWEVRPKQPREIDRGHPSCA